MQVNATLIAAQHAAREAQAKFHAAHVAAPGAPKPAFSAALEKVAGKAADSFSPLPLRQIAPKPEPAAAAQTQSFSRLGTQLDITV